jgi:hypothetical protein
MWPAPSARLGLETPRRLHDPLHPTLAGAGAATTFPDPTARRPRAQSASRYSYDADEARASVKRHAREHARPRSSSEGRVLVQGTRTFDVDIRRCARCDGSVRVRAVVTDADAIQKLLAVLHSCRAAAFDAPMTAAQGGRLGLTASRGLRTRTRPTDRTASHALPIR